ESAPSKQIFVDTCALEALAWPYETHHHHRTARAPRRGQGGAVPGRRHRDLADPRQRPRGRAGDRRAVPRHHSRHGIPRKSEDRNGVLRAVRAAVHRRHPVFRPDRRGGRRQDLRAADRARHPHPHGRGGQRGAHGSQRGRGPAGGAQTRTTRRRGSRGRGGGIMRLPLLALDAAAISAGDTAWVLTSTALVMVMTVGLAFFYGGLVRPKNALNTMMMSVVALGLISVQWVLFGYSIAFGHGSPRGGGLQKLGALDFAGGTVVHISSGVSALVAARMLGPRRDFKRAAIVPHNVPLVLLGAGLLWFGWFGFNAGSALAANGLAALAFTNTNTAAAMALVTWACLDLIRTGKATAVGAATGLVVGLVAITPAAGFVTAPASLVIGALAAVVSYTAIQIRARTRLDDSLDVFSCHGLGGAAGALLTGVFATKLANPAGGDGWLAGNFAQMGVQLVAVLATVALAALGTAVILTIVKATVGIKADVRAQLRGLDLSEHGEEAYFGEQGAIAGSGTALGESVVVSAV